MVAVFLVISLIHLDFEHRLHQESARREAAFLLDRLQDGVADALLEGNLPAARRLATGFSLHDAVRLVVVIDSDRRILLSTVGAWTGTPAVDRDGFDPSRWASSQWERSEQSALRLVADPDAAWVLTGIAPVPMRAMPGVLTPAPVGMLVVRFDFGPTYAVRGSAVCRDLVRMGLAIVGIILVSWLALSVAVTGPVTRISAAAKRFADGDMASRVALPRPWFLSPETQQLAATFNTLADVRARDLYRLEDQKARLTEAARRRRQLEAALEASPSAIVMLAPDQYGITHANRAFCAMAGAPATALIGQSLPRLCAVLGAGDGLGRVEAALVERTTVAEELELTVARGTIRCAVSLGPVFGPEGELDAFVACFIDVTGQRRQEERWRHLQKMEALGQLAGGVAHEINNLLQPILTFSTLARKGVDPGSTVERYHLHIQDCCRRARDIIRNVLTFARGSTPRLDRLDLNEATAAAITFVRDSLPPSLRIVLALHDQPVMAAANGTEFTQVMLNLIANARDAIGDQGEIRVRLCVRSLDAAEADELKLEPGSFALLQVSDDGIGMTEEVRRCCLEPFFSTKPADRGTGLGLSVAVGILQTWHGTIAVDSEPGRGTNFSVYVPV